MFGKRPFKLLYIVLKSYILISSSTLIESKDVNSTMFLLFTTLTFIDADFVLSITDVAVIVWRPLYVIRAIPVSESIISELLYPL